MTAGKYTVNEVEERTGVPAPTLRQWERRYGVPKPERSPAGYRLYSDADINDIRALKAHVDDGVPASRAAQLVGRRAAAGPRPLTELRHELTAALVGLDEALADRIIAEAHALYSVDTVVLELFQPTMIDIGNLWHEGVIKTTTEHFASSYVQGRLRQLLSLAGSNLAGQRVIVACAPLEQHELGALVLAVLLRRAGFQVFYLGANTPLEDLAAMARAVEPIAVMISAASRESAHQLIDERRHLEGVAPLLVLGGQAFNADPALADRIGGRYLARDAGEAATRLHELAAAVASSPKESPHGPS
jgi:MerR family transcriptional regulator, light-induced transcriptional regulator